MEMTMDRGDTTTQRYPVTMMVITNATNLDPIRVITENYGPGKGRIIIQCWDRAWCSAWFAMSGQTVEQFFLGAFPDYLVSSLTAGLHGMTKKSAKNDEVYLLRIIDAVKHAFANMQ